jgi:hypothetical protein
MPIQNPYPVKIIFGNEGEVDTLKERRVKRLLARRPSSKDLLEGVVQMEKKWHQKEIWAIQNDEATIEMVNIWVNILE